MKIAIYSFLILLGFSNSLSCQKTAENTSFRAAFYNVENLFDTVDEPIKIDEEFLPSGRKEWTTKRYDKKLMDLGRVVKAMEYPAILGVCEVENKAVLVDLIKEKQLVDVHYGIVHFESPDMRGIDAGLLFDTDIFTLDSSSYIRVLFPDWLEPDGYTSRDIIYARLLDAEGVAFHVFVNHWPSRRGGAEASEKRRVWVAAHLRQAVSRVLAADASAKVIIMGDFNDEPTNNSISHALGALPVNDSTFLLPGLLYNSFHSLDGQEGIGSYNYRGDWNMLDQIIIAGFDQTSTWKMSSFGIFKEDWLLYKGDKGTSPSKTYGGPNYYGGFSDHLPVYMDFSHN